MHQTRDRADEPEQRRNANNDFKNNETSLQPHHLMVQRMLTAPDIRRSRRSLVLSGLADIPIVLTFLTIGLLLWTYYQVHPDPTLPKTPNETFCHFILYQMPVGLRGLLIAGIFATAMLRYNSAATGDTDVGVAVAVGSTDHRASGSIAVSTTAPPNAFANCRRLIISREILPQSAR